MPTHFPALLQAQKISRRAVAVGFEWDTLDDVWDKVAEERAELEAAYEAAPKTPDGKVLPKDPGAYETPRPDVDPLVEVQIDLDPQGVAFVAHPDPLGRREKIPPRGRRVVFLKFL